MDLIIHELEQAITLVGLNGELNSASIQNLLDSVGRLLDTGRPRIIIDCSNLTFVSSAGIGSLVTLHRRVKTAEGEVRFAGTTGAIFEVLEMMNLGSILDLSPDVEHALEALRHTEDDSPG